MKNNQIEIVRETYHKENAKLVKMRREKIFFDDELVEQLARTTMCLEILESLLD